tara:strand:+ start:365 stop:724 length:360 start_codon:yes stop_codon:yes gene_type:complete
MIKLTEEKLQALKTLIIGCELAQQENIYTSEDLQTILNSTDLVKKLIDKSKSAFKYIEPTTDKSTVNHKFSDGRKKRRPDGGGWKELKNIKIDYPPTVPKSVQSLNNWVNKLKIKDTEK